MDLALIPSKFYPKPLLGFQNYANHGPFVGVDNFVPMGVADIDQFTFEVVGHLNSPLFCLHLEPVVV